MPLLGNIRRLDRRDPSVRAIAHAWRELTGGTRRGRDAARRTLLACSGGADSSALVLALSTAAPTPQRLFVVAHVVHDLRPLDDALADRDAARALADMLGLPYAESRVAVRGRPGNAEANARRLRYEALDRLAGEHRCPYIATAHHADDQFESMLMALVRGAGPSGLAGVALTRRLGAGRVIRPMLGVTRADARRLCADAAWTWREDATNTDQSRLRAAIRGRIMPVLESLRPGAARRAARSARLLAGAAAVLAQQAAQLAERGDCDHGFAWDRRDLRRAPEVVVSGALRRAAERIHEGRFRDRIGQRIIAPVVRAVRSRSTDPRRFAWPGLDLLVDARRVVMRPSRPPPA